jgi:hypothetical protein
MTKNQFGISVPRSILELFGIVFLRFRPVPRIWVAWLVAVNSVSLLFIRHMEAQVVLGAVGLAVLAQALIYQRKRFIRLLGTTHFIWVPMLTWIALRLDSLPVAESAYHAWLLTLIVTNALCLVIDSLDLTRFVRGDRKPYYTW